MYKKILILTTTIICLSTCFATGIGNTSISTAKLSLNEDLSNLTITDIKINSLKGFKGNTIVIEDTILNQGNKSITKFWVNYYLKTEKGQKISIGQHYTEHLDNGTSPTQQTRLKIPKNISNGSYYITAQINNTNITQQSNKTIQVQDFPPVYITSDNINNKRTDNTRINLIVQELKKEGIKAINYGVGPNTHYTVLKDKKVPSNALIVNIYGGVCAGTIWEMNSTHYKHYKGNRTIFTIWIHTLLDIDNITFLRRAHDDNFTPLPRNPGCFPDTYDINHNGKIEPGQPKREDGLKNPATYLKKWNYPYYYMQKPDTHTLAQKIQQTP